MFRSEFMGFIGKLKINLGVSEIWKEKKKETLTISLVTGRIYGI